MAVLNRNPEGAILLLDFGANPNLVSRSGSLILKNAVFFDMTKLAIKLLDLGANSDAIDQYKWSIHDYIVLTKQVEVLRCFYLAGPDVYQSDKHRRRLLHVAILCGNLDILKMLIASDVDVHSPNIHGKCPLDIAIEQNELK